MGTSFSLNEASTASGIPAGKIRMAIEDGKIQAIKTFFPEYGRLRYAIEEEELRRWMKRMGYPAEPLNNWLRYNSTSEQRKAQGRRRRNKMIYAFAKNWSAAEADVKVMKGWEKHLMTTAQVAEAMAKTNDWSKVPTSQTILEIMKSLGYRRIELEKDEEQK